MALNPPTTPDECFALSPFGFGPYPFTGSSQDYTTWSTTAGGKAWGYGEAVANQVFDPARNFDPNDAQDAADWQTLVDDGVLDPAAVVGGVIAAEDLLATYVEALATAQNYPLYSILTCPAHPHGSGYGGVGFAPNTIVADPGGGAFGLMGYGAAQHGGPPIPVQGGYGGDPYGLSPYGAGERTPPRIASALSLSGFEIEVFFSEEMDSTDPALVDPTNYTITAVTGAAATPVSVTIETLGSVDVTQGDTIGGATSVIIRHTGTTQGGTYKVTAQNLKDIAGNIILGVEASLLTRGDPPNYTLAALSGEEVLLTFDQKMLVAEPGNDIDQAASYGFTSSPSYPILLSPTAISHPYQGDAAKVGMKVKGMTSLLYTCNLSPALAYQYTPTTLPDQASGFTAVEVNPTGGSSSLSGGNLTLGKLVNQTYGWSFLDISGRVVPSTSTFKADLTFDASVASFTPALSSYASPEVFELLIEDGPQGTGVQVRLTLQKDANGDDAIRIRSGNYDLTLAATWSDKAHTLSLVRNIKAAIYTILLDGLPLTSTPMVNFNQPAQGTGAGMQLTLVGAFATTGFRLNSLRYTATTTVYSNAWNFMHEVQQSFTGSAALTRDTLKTQRGPLVKGWGNATPATKKDVTVLVAGTEVVVADVNPYLGEIKLAVPVPLMPVNDPQADVKVDYKWFASPIMALDGLNTPGLVLNKWDRSTGHNDSPFRGPGNGAADIHRFPMAVVLGPSENPQPLHIGHRYMGFEREYSAMLNSPTTLLLNQNPHRTPVEGFEQVPVGVAGAYDGVGPPTGWALSGDNTGGGPVPGKGTFIIEDTKSGSFDPADPQAVVYSREADLTFPSSTYLVARLQVEDAAALLDTANTNILVTDGVFTGVGFGMHDNLHLFMAGALLVNGLEHVGLLVDPLRPHQVEAWSIGPTATGTVKAKDTISFKTTDVPDGFVATNRFQVLTGSQAGVYTASSVVHQTDGTATVKVTPNFPADWKLYGATFPVAAFESPWSGKSSTWRLETDPDQEVATLTISGSISGKVATLDGSLAGLPSPADTSLLLDLENEGQVFWGSLSRRGTNRSEWSFFRYGIIPDATAVRGQAINVAAEMSDLPENDPNDDWFRFANHGYSRIDDDDRLWLKSTSAHETLGFTFGYERTEPFFNPQASLDISARLRVDSAVLGAGDAQLVLNDTNREVKLGTLMWVEQPGQVEFRRLLRCPVLSLAGSYEPDKQGWASSGTATGKVQGPNFEVAQVAGQTAAWTRILDLTQDSFLALDEGGRVCEARLAVDTYTGGAAGEMPVRFGFNAQVPGGYGFIGVRLKAGASPGVLLVDGNGATVQEYSFDWTDKGQHTYRIVVDVTGVVALLVDEVAQTPTLTTAQFPAVGGTAEQVSFGAYDTTGDGKLASAVHWNSVSLTALPPVATKRTLGILVGDDPDHINSWELPRTDTSTTVNSTQTGPVIQEWDWRSVVELRILRTPDWGITVFRPDLPLPPYYNPEDPGVPGSGYATENAQPSAGWINVEYGNLPRKPDTFGSVRFGSPDSRSISQQRWEWVRYRLFKSLTEDVTGHQHMVLNYHNVVTSGERTGDMTLESVSVQALDTRRASLRPAHITARHVYKVIDGTTSFIADQWTFDVDSQTLTLDAGLSFSAEHAPLTVTFAPGKPVTETYLKAQPLLDSITKLNEGTPPIPKSQTAEAEREVVFGSQLNDPKDVLNDDEDFLLNDPYRVATFKDDPDSLYESLKFFEVEDGGDLDLIATPGEGVLPEGFSGFSQAEDEAVGAHVLVLSGTKFWEPVPKPSQPDFQQGGGMPGHIFMASGGDFQGPVVDANGKIIGKAPLGGNLGPGTAVLYPSFPSDFARSIADRGKVYRRTDWFIRLDAVLTDATPDSIPGLPQSIGGSVGSSIGASIRDFWEVPLAENVMALGIDAIPPSRPHEWTVNPNGSQNSKGAAYGVMAGAGDFSRIGPWGGLPSLTPDPDIGYFEFVDVGLLEGTVLTITEESGVVVATFTAKAVPINPGDFAIAPQPHVNLAMAINAHPTASQYVEAESGLTWSGRFSVAIEALLPVTVTNLVSMGTSNPAAVRLVGTGPGGELTGGAKMTQSSLLAGGTSSLSNGTHDPKRGMVCQGGTALPQGRQTAVVFQASA